MHYILINSGSNPHSELLLHPLPLEKVSSGSGVAGYTNDKRVTTGIQQETHALQAPLLIHLMGLCSTWFLDVQHRRCSVSVTENHCASFYRREMLFLDEKEELELRPLSVLFCKIEKLLYKRHCTNNKKLFLVHPHFGGIYVWFAKIIRSLRLCNKLWVVIRVKRLHKTNMWLSATISKNQQFHSWDETNKQANKCIQQWACNIK